MSFPVDKFIWSDVANAFHLRAFVNIFESALPKFVKIVEGHLWSDEDFHSYASGEIFFINSVGQHTRVLVRDKNDVVLAIPRDYTIPFHQIDPLGKTVLPDSMPRLISDIISGYPHIRDEDKYIRLHHSENVYFRADKSGATTRVDGGLEIIKVIDQSYLEARGIVDDEFSSKTAHIPLTFPLTVTVCTGVADHSLLHIIQRAEGTFTDVEHPEVTKVDPLWKEITVFADEFSDTFLATGGSYVIPPVPDKSRPARPEIANHNLYDWPSNAPKPLPCESMSSLSSRASSCRYSASSSSSDSELDAMGSVNTLATLQQVQTPTNDENKAFFPTFQQPNEFMRSKPLTYTDYSYNRTDEICPIEVTLVPGDDQRYLQHRPSKQDEVGDIIQDIDDAMAAQSDLLESQRIDVTSLGSDALAARDHPRTYHCDPRDAQSDVMTSCYTSEDNLIEDEVGPLSGRDRLETMLVYQEAARYSGPSSSSGRQTPSTSREGSRKSGARESLLWDGSPTSQVFATDEYPFSDTEVVLMHQRDGRDRTDAISDSSLERNGRKKKKKSKSGLKSFFSKLKSKFGKKDKKKAESATASRNSHQHPVITSGPTREMTLDLHVSVYPKYDDGKDAVFRPRVAQEQRSSSVKLRRRTLRMSTTDDIKPAKCPDLASMEDWTSDSFLSRSPPRPPPPLPSSPPPPWPPPLSDTTIGVLCPSVLPLNPPLLPSSPPPAVLSPSLGDSHFPFNPPMPTSPPPLLPPPPLGDTQFSFNTTTCSAPPLPPSPPPIVVGINHSSIESYIEPTPLVRLLDNDDDTSDDGSDYEKIDPNAYRGVYRRDGDNLRLPSGYYDRVSDSDGDRNEVVGGYSYATAEGTAGNRRRRSKRRSRARPFPPNLPPLSGQLNREIVVTLRSREHGASWNKKKTLPTSKVKISTPDPFVSELQLKLEARKKKCDEPDELEPDKCVDMGHTTSAKQVGLQEKVEQGAECPGSDLEDMDDLDLNGVMNRGRYNDTTSRRAGCTMTFAGGTRRRRLLSDHRVVPEPPRTRVPLRLDTIGPRSGFQTLPHPPRPPKLHSDEVRFYLPSTDDDCAPQRPPGRHTLRGTTSRADGYTTDTVSRYREPPIPDKPLPPTPPSSLGEANDSEQSDKT